MTWSAPLTLSFGDLRVQPTITAFAKVFRITVDASAIPNEVGLNLDISTTLTAVPGDDAPPVDTAPNPPSGLGVTGTGSDQFDIEWTDNSSNEDGFEVQRALDPQFGAGFGTQSFAADAESGTVTVPYTGLWYWRLRSFNDTGSSEWRSPSPNVPADVQTGTDPPGTAIPWVRRPRITMGRFFS
jgi:hypothetical protein